MMRAWLLEMFFGVAALTAGLATSLGAAVPEKLADGIVVPLDGGYLKLEVRAANVVRVAYAKDRRFFARDSLMLAPPPPSSTRFDLSTDTRQATLATAELRVRVDLASGAVRFYDRDNRPILYEKDGGRALEPAVVQGERTFHVRQQWEASADEALYGLGQHQTGIVNVKGYDVDLWQHNGTVVVPFLLSSRGYGLLWDNTSFSRFGDLRPFEPPPPAQLLDAKGRRGGWTASCYAGGNFERLVAERVEPRIDIAVPSEAKDANQRIHPDLPPGEVSVRWEGAIEPEKTGEYQIQTFSNNGVKVWVDDALVIDHWRQGWLPWINVARLRLDAKRRYHVKVEWTKDQGMETMSLRWKTPGRGDATSLWSEVGDGVDYYFVYGPELDQVIAGYRHLTGQAPMMPIWAFGLWQSRQRYTTQQESLDVVQGFRSRHIPFDNIVQDWRYWKDPEWGSHRFDPERFPDPEGWVHQLHEQKARLMISVWPKFYPGTENFEAMRSRGFLYEPNLSEGIRDWLGYPDTFYDAFNADARRLFWRQIDSALFSKGIDAWWMDATEPDLLPTPTLDGQRAHVHPTALGSGARVLNAYPLMQSRGVYEGQRASAPNQRVFILTRSGFAGQQRYAAAVWSGDISSTWTALRAQIAAGLGFSISGLPYWTMDIGGFSVPARFARENPAAEDVEEWRELNARWFQFGTFCPLLRVHGEFPNREMWFMGGESHPAYKTQLKFDRLRYRLLPYIYSLAGAVTREDRTIMRPLVMDFRADPRVRDIADEYLFGPAFLVSPVTTYKARSRPVYLPQGSRWYDFWTGVEQRGGETIEAEAPYDSMPLHVRAGALVPLGPAQEYTNEKPADPITLYVYEGADGELTLYEDDGLSYDYEKGQLATIRLRWNDAAKTLTIGQRQGHFAGMLPQRTFGLVFVSSERPVGYDPQRPPDQTVRYEGSEIEIAKSR
jgi:alpha-D-xyloside xylohydrolase